MKVKKKSHTKVLESEIVHKREGQEEIKRKRRRYCAFCAQI